MIFISFLGSRRGNVKKKAASVQLNYQPAEQNLLHEGNIFKHTVDPRERPSDRISIRSATKL